MSTIHWYQNPHQGKRERERVSLNMRRTKQMELHIQTTGVKCNNAKKLSEMGKFFFPHRRSSNHTSHQKDN